MESIEKIVPAPAGPPRFYGTTLGTVFAMRSDGAVTTLHRFDSPGNISALREGRDGNLYGTTDAGGTSGSGSVFQIVPDGSFSTLYAFAAGDQDYSGVVPADDGSLWGAASGHFGGGMIFKITR